MAPLSTERVNELIQEALDVAFEGAVPDMVEAVRDQLIEVMNERFAHFMANLPNPNAGGPHEFQNRDFTDCKTSEFLGGVDPIVSMRWLAEVEGAFVTSSCPENKKVTLARNLLKGVAGDWWAVRTAEMTPAQVAAMTWAQFVEWFRAKFIPRVEVERISLEFQNLKQTTETIQEMNKKFTEMERFCPLYAANKEMKISRYLGMLREDIREFVSTARYTTLAELMDAARRREIYLATNGKRKEAPIAAVPVASYSRKRRYETRSGSKGSEATKTGGETSASVMRCFKCGKSGHRVRECPERATVGGVVCFECGKLGHVRRDCPEVKRGPPPTAQLRITEGRPAHSHTECGTFWNVERKRERGSLIFCFRYEGGSLIRNANLVRERCTI